MYQSNLNYLNFNRYLKDFLCKGFLEAIKDIDGKNSYCITQKGKSLLLALRKAHELGYE
jgi:predicted transcriptional regulator